MVRVRFEGDIRRGALCPVARLLQRQSLRVFEIRKDVVAFACQPTLSINDHAADQWPRANEAHAASGQGKRTLHHLSIKLW